MRVDADDDDRDEFEEELDDDDTLDNPAFESELEADLIEEWCPVCKGIKPHAKSGDKLICAVCNHEHCRKDEPMRQAPVVQKILSAADMASAESLHAAWKRLVQVDEGEIETYTIHLGLCEGQVIRHAKFGIGIVTQMVDTTKAEILFADGLHRLVCCK